MKKIAEEKSASTVWKIGTEYGTGIKFRIQSLNIGKKKKMVLNFC
jgi:hypothetical protein